MKNLLLSNYDWKLDVLADAMGEREMGAPLASCQVIVTSRLSR